MSDDEDFEDLFSLVMPFITVTSVGGPHDDSAYVAGFQMGQLDMILKESTVPVEWSIHVTNTPQADLIAMRHGFTMTTEPLEDSSHVFAIFTP